MKKIGAELAIYALEQIGVKYTYGIPGTHNTELYDQLNTSTQITPILVTHEGGGAFMGDATSRTSAHIGTLMIVPASGLTHAMSGIGEAFLDGIAMLVISGGVRRDLAQHYKLHDIDQIAMTKPITKAQFLITSHQDIIPTIYKAYDIAISGQPGPVFIDLPVDIQMYTGEVGNMPAYKPSFALPAIATTALNKIVSALHLSKNPMLYLGWGAIKGYEYSVKLAELLAAPVATSLQGKSAFPNSHPLYTCAGIGKGAKPSGQWALKQHDLLLTVGARFGEVATASYSLEQPKQLIHIDINPDVFNKNYKADITLVADGADFIKQLYEALIASNYQAKQKWADVGKELTNKNEAYYAEWLKTPKNDRVQPGLFFKALQNKTPKDVIVVTDDGHHTFLTGELMDINAPAAFVSPTDFNCMGYCVPATIAAQLNNPTRLVVGIVGDGAILMTGLELVTSSRYDIPVIVFIFNDGELGQIAQFQKIPLNRKTCTVLGDIQFKGIATVAGIDYVEINNDLELQSKMDEAFDIRSKGKSVLVNVKMDYSQKTRLTKGVIAVNLERMPLDQKMRFLGRAVRRFVFG